MGKAAQSGAVIHRVDPNGIGGELGLAPGDRLLRINGERLIDLIDYSLLTSAEHLELLIEKADGEIWEISVEKDEDEGLGLDFASPVFDRIIPCNNRCVFCFVDQMPPGQRPSLYVKDDDYRLSFLQGSYITLSNLRKQDWERIRRLRLSPLYVSVHATDPAVRERLLGSKRAGSVLEDLRRLGEWGIRCHTQAVLCPGINDGEALERTIRDLSELWPTVQSLAIVPVGLTSHRTGLPELRRFLPHEARKVVDTVEYYQKRCQSRMGTRWLWPSDEFYLQAELPIPPLETYEDLVQLENGVGLWRLFEDEFKEAVRNRASFLAKASGSFGIVTGRDAAGLWQSLTALLRSLAPRLRLTVYPVENRFFGPSVTVAGLVTGQDILDALRNANPPAETMLLLPRSMLRRDEDVFLDGVRLTELQEASGLRILPVEVDGEAAVKALCASGEEEQ